MTNSHSYEKLEKVLHDFVAERDWQRFHSPKNLAMALTVETAELLEIFQWLSEEQSCSSKDVDTKHLEEEIGDVMIYLSTLSSKFGINPIEAALKKAQINHKKYPAEKVRGKADKSNRYVDPEK